MSQFKFQNDMNNLLNLDGELKMNSKPRWQRKMENSMNASSINGSKLSVSYNNSYVAGMGLNTTTTGSKTPNKSIVEGASKKKTPNEKKSPGMNKRSRRSSPKFYSSSFTDFRSQDTDAWLENTNDFRRSIYSKPRRDKLRT